MTPRPAAALVAALALAATACDAKLGSFFRPAGETTPDAAAPVFRNPLPPPDIEVVSADQFTIEVTDPAEDGLPGSGVDPFSIEALLVGGGPLPAIVNLPRITIDVRGVTDGRVQIVVVARDLAGNQATYIFDHVLDRTPPPLDFRVFPPSNVSTSERVFSATVHVDVGPEPHFDSGAVEVRTPGPDGTCGTADDGAVPTGVLAEPTRPLLGSGVHAFTFFLNNPVSPGGAAMGATYCWVATVVDTALGAGGQEGVNRSTIARRTDLFWLPPST